MIVGTTEAAKILNISTARLRTLLIAGRVEGAYKTGKMWLMPLFNGKPIIKRGTRGPKPRWCNPRKPAKKIIHVNSHRIRQNQKQSTKQPVITVKTQENSRNLNLYGYEVEILGGCRVVYRPDNPKCGAKVWIETLHDVKIIS
ncbi:MAG: DNA-binding protein [Microcoleaceae cyanobacterium]